MRVGVLLPGVAAVGVLALQGCGGDEPARTVTVTTAGASTTPVAPARTTASVPTTTAARPAPRPGSTTSSRPATTTVVRTVATRPPSPGTSPAPDRPSGTARGTAAPGPETFDPVGGTTLARGRADGTGYSVLVPTGWNDGAKRFEGSSVDFDRTYVKGRGSDVTSNILVVRSTPSGARSRGIAGLAATVRRELASGAGGADVAQNPARRVDGAAAVAFLVRRSLGDTEIVQRQIATVHDGALYTIGLTAPRRSYVEDARAFGRFLDSWRWAERD